LVRLWECETFIPKLGLLPHSLQTAATMTRTSMEFLPGTECHVSIQRMPKSGADRRQGEHVSRLGAS